MQTVKWIGFAEKAAEIVNEFKGLHALGQNQPAPYTSATGRIFLWNASASENCHVYRKSPYKI
jgi:hypothetical protein